MPKDFSKRLRPNFADSPMYQEHDEKIEEVLDGQSENTETFEAQQQPIAKSQPILQPAESKPAEKQAAEAPVEEDYKCISIRMPMHIYEQMNKLKYFSGRSKLTIKDMVITATEEWVKAQLVQSK